MPAGNLSPNVASTNVAAAIGRNTFWGIVASLTQMSTRLATVPIVIGYLGLDGYGIWSIIMVAAGYMRFGSAGIKSAFLKYVAEATGSGASQKASKLLSTGSAAMLVVSIIGLIPLAIFSNNLVGAIGVPEHLSASATGAITLLAITMVLSNVGGVYESIVMGGHRIDLIRMFNTVASILEAVAIVGVLYIGYGLFAMAAIMASSEVARLICCYYASRKIVPEIRIVTSNLSSKVLPELFRFAGSYQLVGVLEVLYAAILPLAVLKLFGATIAGVYAVASRLVSAASLPSEAIALPLLSSGSMVYATGSREQIQLLLTNSFKATCALVMLPLAFTATYGPLIILAWTGLADPAFGLILELLCLAALVRGLSVFVLVLYRATGRALLDNVWQVLRVLVLGLVCYFANQAGFLGVIGSLAIAECIGFIFMLVVFTSIFESFSLRSLLPDSIKLLAATAIIISVGSLAMNIPLPWAGDERYLATFKLGVVSLATLVAILPAVLLTGSISRYELSAVLPISLPSSKKYGLRG